MTKEQEARKDVLKKAILKVIENLQPKLKSKFDIHKIVEPSGTRGLLRDELKGKLFPEDKKLVYAVFQDLKQDKILYHIAGIWWSRIK